MNKKLLLPILAFTAILFLRFNYAGITGTFHDLSYTSIDGEQIDMKKYSGSYVLCVNVASECGYTSQYEELQKLYETHKDKLVIIGFPCNQFGGQEPGDEKTIAAFCSKNYGVSFPLSSRVDVKGTAAHPVYSWLTSKQQNGVSDAEIKWNFNKILIGPDGKWIAHFGSKTSPLSDDIVSVIR